MYFYIVFVSLSPFIFYHNAFVSLSFIGSMFIQFFFDAFKLNCNDHPEDAKEFLLYMLFFKYLHLKTPNNCDLF